MFCFPHYNLVQPWTILYLHFHLSLQ